MCASWTRIFGVATKDAKCHVSRFRTLTLHETASSQVIPGISKTIEGAIQYWRKLSSKTSDFILRLFDTALERKSFLQNYTDIMRKRNCQNISLSRLKKLVCAVAVNTGYISTFIHEEGSD